MLLNTWQRYLRRLSHGGFRRKQWHRVRPLRQTQVGLWCERLEDRTMLSTLFVNNGTDAHVDNQLSLREAVAIANMDAAAGTSDAIAFDASLGSHTITLTQGQLELSG